MPPPESPQNLEGTTVALPSPASTEDPTLPPNSAPPAQGADSAREVLACLAPAQATDELGRLGGYRVLRVLGAGGMGVVFLAEDRRLQRLVALKTLLPSLAARDSYLQRFLREARAAAAIDHDNVVPIFDVSDEHGVPFIAMPFLKGESLDARLKREGRLPVADVLRIGREIATGLAAAHACGIVHRDVKPANVWLDDQRGRAMILDFGLARPGADTTQMTQQGMILGTPSYMAPEQVNSQPVDARTDLFSLGGVLYRMATGRLPFEGRDVLATLMAVSTEPARPPRTVCPDLPQALDDLILGMLAKASADRPPSAVAVVEALSRIEADSTRTLIQPPPRQAPSRVPPSRVPPSRPSAPRRAPPASPDHTIAINQRRLLLISLAAAAVICATCVIGLGAFLVWGLAVGFRGPAEAQQAGGGLVQGGGGFVKADNRLSINIPWLDREQGISAHIFQTGITPDSKLFFGAGDAGPTGMIRLFDIRTGMQVQEFRPGRNAWFSNAALVPGDKYLVAGYSQDRDIYLWDVATGKIVRRMTGHTAPEVGIAVAPDGKRLLSWSSDRTLRLWDLDGGNQLRKLEGHTDKAVGRFSPDGKHVLSFSPDKTLRLWDAQTGKELQKFEGHAAACTASFSPDGKQIVSFGADQTIRLWDAQTAQEIRRLKGGVVKDGGHGFVAGGRRVAAYCEDQRYRLWDTATGNIVQQIDLAQVGNDRAGITPSPDGRLALVSHADLSVRLYDLTTGKEIQRYPGCRAARSFSFAPDGTVAVGGSFRAGLYMFRLPQGKL
jgi:serine/threonine protein kinase